MIRHHVQKDAAAAVKYYQLADYLAGGEGPRAELGGRAAAMLGVAGSNDRLHFERLAHNLDPLTGEQLTERMRADRIVGIDVTFDGPKSFSVLEALTPDPALARARREASLETMLEMQEAAAARVRKGGKDENRTTGNLVWYRAEHDTTRPVGGVPDMQPHEHYFVLNATWDKQDGQWKAANLYDVLRDMPYYQAAYHARLAGKLEELGYPVERKGKAYFEVAGVPASACAKFSRRSEQVDEAYHDRLADRLAEGGHGVIVEGHFEVDGVRQSRRQIAALARVKGVDLSPAAKGELGAKTREHKSGELSTDQLRRIWAGKLSAAEQKAIAEVHWGAKRAQAAGRVPATGDHAREAVEHAAAHVFERKSSCPARELLAHALAYGVGKVTVEEAWALLESGDRFTAAVDGRLYVASRAVLEEERKLVKLARDGKASLPAINPEWEIQNTALETDQRAAVHSLLGSHSFVAMLQGAAGSGKTTLLEEARQGAEAAGLKVLAFAPTAQASRVNLAEAGFADAAPVAALLADPRLQQRARGQVILVDEAAMLGTKDAAALLALAKDLGARVWMVGDDRQHRAPGQRGAPFELLQAQAGLVPARVLKSRRQKNKAYKDAVELERKRPGRGLLKLKALGHVKEVPDGERHKALAADYLEAVRPEWKKVGGRWEEVAPTALVIAPTHAEGAMVTEEIRAGLKGRGQLGEEHGFLRLTSLQLTEAQRADPHCYRQGDVIEFTQNAKGHKRGERVALSGGLRPPAQHAARFQAYRPGTISLAEGDRLRITLGGRTKEGHRLNNGDLLTVAGFTEPGDIIDHRGWVIPQDYGHLAHGYTTTSVSGQSRTVDRVLVAAGPESLPAVNRREMYVDLSRGREWARVYCSSAEELASAAARDDREVSASELARLRREQARRGLLDRHLALLRRREGEGPHGRVDSRATVALERRASNER